MISSERYCSSCGAANTLEVESCFACGLSLKITAPLVLEAPKTQPLLQQRYRILAQVGKGGFSAVYRAVDTFYQNYPIAIKAISLSGLKPQEAIEATESFNREILLLSGLKHPNLPRIYHNFSDTECWYLVMDFIEGITLEKHLESVHDGRLPIGEVLEIGLLLCTVLEYLHSRQPAIVFRDLKPANVMLTPSGRIALIDFGIARHFKPGQAKDTMPFGSPGYAAPEQYGKAQTTPRTDIYALGVMLHQLLTGDDPSLTPFRFAPLQLQDQAALDGLETLIIQMVEMDATQRPESIIVVKEELQRITRAWTTQHLHGLRAQGTQYPVGKPVSWQTIVPPVQAGGMPIAASGGGIGQGQMSLFQPPPPAYAGYWSVPPTPQKKSNGMAVASMCFGAASIFVPAFACPSLVAVHLDPFFVPLFIFASVILTSPILAVIFGHIGRRRAKTIPGLYGSGGLATTGLVLGYTFGVIYVLLLLFILVSTLLVSFPS